MEEEMELEYGGSAVGDQVWNILTSLRNLRLQGKWEDAAMHEEEVGEEDDPDEPVAAALESSIADQTGFMQIAGMLWSELAALLEMAPISLPREWSTFKSGLLGFLAGLGYKQAESDLDSAEGRAQIVELLISEIQAARIEIFAAEPHAMAKKIKAVNDDDTNEAGKSIIRICQALNLPQPTDSVAALNTARDKVKELLSTLPADHLGEPLLKKIDLSAQQLDKLKKMNECFIEEYRVRREVLVKRMDVTLHSLACSAKHQAHESEILDVVEVGRQALGKQNTFGIYDILAARDDLTRLYPTNDVTAEATVKRLLIGSVPDRGGRVGEKRVAGTMPTMRERTAPSESGGGGGSRGGNRGGRGGGRGGGGRGNKSGGRSGRVQGGGWDEGAAGERRSRGKGKGADKGQEAAAAADTGGRGRGGGGGGGGGGGWGGPRGRGRGGGRGKASAS